MVLVSRSSPCRSNSEVFSLLEVNSGCSTVEDLICTIFASSRVTSLTGLRSAGKGPLTASINFCEIGLKRFSSIDANLAIDYFPLSLRCYWHLHGNPLKRIKSRLEFACEFTKLVCHLMGWVKLKHCLSLLLTLTDVSRLSNLGLIAPNERIGSPVKGFLYIGNKLSLNPRASTFYR